MPQNQRDRRDIFSRGLGSLGLGQNFGGPLGQSRFSRTPSSPISQVSPAVFRESFSADTPGNGIGNIRNAFNRAPMNLREGFPQRGGGEGGAPPGGESAPAGGVHGPMSQGTNNGVGRSRSGVATAEADSLGGFLGSVATGITGPLAPVGAMIGAITNAISATENNTTMTPDISVANAIANIFGIENPLSIEAIVDNVISNPPTAAARGRFSLDNNDNAIGLGLGPIGDFGGRAAFGPQVTGPIGAADSPTGGFVANRGLSPNFGSDVGALMSRGVAVSPAGRSGGSMGPPPGGVHGPMTPAGRQNQNNADMGVGFGRGRGGVDGGGMPPGGVHGPMTAAGNSGSSGSSGSSGAPAGGGGFAPGPEGAGVRRHGGYIPHDGDEKLEMSPIKVHEGEFVISPEATAMIGLPMLRALNALGRLRYG